MSFVSLGDQVSQEEDVIVVAAFRGIGPGATAR